MNLLRLCCVAVLLLSCNDKNKESVVLDQEVEDKATTAIIKEQSVMQLKEQLKTKGFEVFEYVDEKTQDTILMQQYFMAFLKTGKHRHQSDEEAKRLQEAHLAHLGKMYDLGYADISGPFGGDGAIRGITIYNVPTLQMADSLANSDPMVKAGRLEIEIHPWWAAKGFKLR
ncbi:YciI family protein [Psychroserpens damuponensis]|uniref:YciI family protein n=1 Tax=Psychroserpens damuponensis TaxID=943936 RepID=UPI00058C7EA4|nr:YciI family protein [Psychroserpens damuponensis]